MGTVAARKVFWEAWAGGQSPGTTLCVSHSQNNCGGCCNFLVLLPVLLLLLLILLLLPSPSPPPSAASPPFYLFPFSSCYLPHLLLFPTSFSLLSFSFSPPQPSLLSSFFPDFLVSFLSSLLPQPTPSEWGLKGSLVPVIKAIES